MIESAKRVDEKKRAVAGLGDIAANESIELLTKLSGDEALLSDVTSAALRLGRQRQGPRERINTLLETIAAKPGVSDEQKKQIAEVLKEGGPRRRR